MVNIHKSKNAQKQINKLTMYHVGHIILANCEIEKFYQNFKH